MLWVADFNVVVRLNIARCHNTGTRCSQSQLCFIFAVHDKRHTLEIQQNLNNVLLHALDSRVLVQNAVNFHFGNCATWHGRQQNTAECIAERVTKATLKRLECYQRSGL